jgi:hypothetical protein
VRFHQLDRQNLLSPLTTKEPSKLDFFIYLIQLCERV